MEEVFPLKELGEWLQLSSSIHALSPSPSPPSPSPSPTPSPLSTPSFHFPFLLTPSLHSLPPAVAKDGGNMFLSHHHHGVFGLINKGRWSCCANPRRACPGCSPSTIVEKKGDATEVHKNSDNSGIAANAGNSEYSVLARVLFILWDPEVFSFEGSGIHLGLGLLGLRC